MADDLPTLLDSAKATTEAEFEAAWERCLQQAPKKRPLAIREARRMKIPRVGTVTQRSSAVNQRKIKALMETPPSPPPRRRDRSRKPLLDDKREQLTELFGNLSDSLSDAETPPGMPATTDATTPHAVRGPAGPPLVTVRVDRHNVMVPYFATVVTRKYKVCVGDRRCLLLFDRTSQCLYARKQ